MKKIAIIALIVFTTGLTAFSLTKKESNTHMKSETSSVNKTDPSVTSLATAD